MDAKGIASGLLDMAARLEHASAQFYQQASKCVTDDDVSLHFLTKHFTYLSLTLSRQSYAKRVPSSVKTC